MTKNYISYCLERSQRAIKFWNHNFSILSHFCTFYLTYRWIIYLFEASVHETEFHRVVRGWMKDVHLSKVFKAGVMSCFVVKIKISLQDCWLEWPEINFRGLPLFKLPSQSEDFRKIPEENWYPIKFSKKSSYPIKIPSKRFIPIDVFGKDSRTNFQFKRYYRLSNFSPDFVIHQAWIPLSHYG